MLASFFGGPYPNPIKESALASMSNKKSTFVEIFSRIFLEKSKKV